MIPAPAQLSRVVDVIGNKKRAGMRQTSGVQVCPLPSCSHGHELHDHDSRKHVATQLILSATLLVTD